MKRVLIFLAIAVLIPTVHAQNRMTYSVVSPQNGHVALGLAIRKLNVSGTFMQMPAHPDDETNALFALFTHGMGLRSIDVQNNRGEGGQNEIGPELCGDRAHEATTILAREAYRAAGDPNRYPEQVRQGLHAWQPKKLYFAAGFGVVPAGGRFGRGGRGSGQAPPPITPESQTPRLKVTR